MAKTGCGNGAEGCGNGAESCGKLRKAEKRGSYGVVHPLRQRLCEDHLILYFPFCHLLSEMGQRRFEGPIKTKWSSYNPCRTGCKALSVHLPYPLRKAENALVFSFVLFTKRNPTANRLPKFRFHQKSNIIWFLSINKDQNFLNNLARFSFRQKSLISSHFSLFFPLETKGFFLENDEKKKLHVVFVNMFGNFF